MDRDRESIYLLDMRASRPEHAISDDFEKGKWTAVDYTIEQGPGSMLFCGPDTDAPPLTLELGVEGWFHVFVGTYRHLHHTTSALLLKLSGDPGYMRATAETFRTGKDLVPPEMLPGKTDISEAYWKAADLTGQQIIFHRPAAGEMAEAATNISYVRLVPCSEAERRRAEHDRHRTDTKRTIANYDGGQHHIWGLATRREMVDEFQALAESDFKMVLWGCARSFSTLYPSKVKPEVEWSFGMPGTPRVFRQSVDRRRRLGFDPLREAIACAREIGIEIYPQVRMVGTQLPPDHRRFTRPDEFQTRHPELRCTTPQGHPTRHLSQAYPEVRKEYVELFREWVEDYHADGVSNIFCRSWPYALYEEPVAASFRERHGIEMTNLDLYDERVLAHRAGFLTELLRETRRMLDEVGAERGRRLGTCYVVAGDVYPTTDCPDLGPFTTPRAVGIDVETWVREGLVDHLVVHFEDKRDPEGRETTELLRPYVELAEGTGTQVYADLYPRRQSAESMRVRALSCYEAGIDGLCFWDSHMRASRLSGWAMHRLLGHKEELKDMRGFAGDLFRVVPIISLDGYTVQEEFGLPTDG